MRIDAFWPPYCSSQTQLHFWHKCCFNCKFTLILNLMSVLCLMCRYVEQKEMEIKIKCKCMFWISRSSSLYHVMYHVWNSCLFHMCAAVSCGKMLYPFFSPLPFLLKWACPGCWMCRCWDGYSTRLHINVMFFSSIFSLSHLGGEAGNKAVFWLASTEVGTSSSSSVSPLQQLTCLFYKSSCTALSHTRPASIHT